MNLSTARTMFDFELKLKKTYQTNQHDVGPTFNINKLLIVDVLSPHRMLCQFINIWLYP